MPSDRRNPHRRFDPRLIEPFLNGRTIESADLLASGKSNSNYKLVLADGSTYVLRLYSHGSAARETYVMNLVRELVPVPVEVYRGETWSVFSFLEGRLLEEMSRYAGVAAEALARIHSVMFSSPGWIEADGSITPFTFGGGNDFMATMLEHPDVLAWIGNDAAATLARIWKRETPRLEQIDAECCLVHGDFNPTNILIHDGRVSGILDWEFAHANTPYMDIGNLLRNIDPAYHDDIGRGLESAGMSLPDDWQERAELIDLGSHLEFLTSQRSDEFKRQCVTRVQRFIERFEKG